MSALSVRLPDSVHETVKALAEKDNISINQFIVSAVAEKIAAFETQQYLEKRSQRASKNKFIAVLSKVPATEPKDLDK